MELMRIADEPELGSGSTNIFAATVITAIAAATAAAAPVPSRTGFTVIAATSEYKSAYVRT